MDSKLLKPVFVLITPHIQRNKNTQKLYTVYHFQLES